MTTIPTYSSLSIFTSTLSPILKSEILSPVYLNLSLVTSAILIRFECAYIYSPTLEEVIQTTLPVTGETSLVFSNSVCRFSICISAVLISNSIISLILLYFTISPSTSSSCLFIRSSNSSKLSIASGITSCTDTSFGIFSIVFFNFSSFFSSSSSSKLANLIDLSALDKL